MSFFSRLTMALGLAVLVTIAFAAYAFLAPPTYVAQATVALAASDAAPGAVGFAPLEAARRIREAVLDAATLQSLRAAFGEDTRGSPGNVLVVDSTDGRSFTVRVSARRPNDARSLADLVAQRVVERAPGVLAGNARGERVVRARARAVDELVTYAVAHPEVTATPPREEVAPPVVAEWRRLLKTATSASSLVAGPSAPALGQARIVARASVPATPLEPDRRRVLGLGFAASFVVALVFMLASSSGAVPRAPAVPTITVPPSAPLPRLSEQPGAVPATPVTPAVAPAAGASPSSPPATTLLPPPMNVGAVLEVPRSDPPPQLTSPALAATQLAASQGPITPAPTLDATAPRASVRPEVPPDTLQWRSGAPSPTGPASSHPPRGAPHRSTQILGSPVLPRTAHLAKPSPPPQAAVSSRPPGAFTGARYSYVSSPAPDKVPPIRPWDLGSEWKAPADLNVTRWRALRRELFALGISRCFVVAITCVPGARSLSSRLAAELAVALAEPGQARVLVVEGDLEAPILHRRLRVEMPQGEGLSEQLARAARDPEHVWTVARCSKSLHVIAEGPGMSTNRPPMGALAACVESVRTCYDFIVVDGMPTGDASAATALDTLADGVIVVSSPSGLEEATKLLAAFDTKRFARAVPCD